MTGESLSFDKKAAVINLEVDRAAEKSDPDLMFEIRRWGSNIGLAQRENPVAKAILLAWETERLGRVLGLTWISRVEATYKVTDEERLAAKHDDGSDPDFEWYPVYPEDHPNHPANRDRLAGDLLDKYVVGPRAEVAAAALIMGNNLLRVSDRVSLGEIPLTRISELLEQYKRLRSGLIELAQTDGTDALTRLLEGSGGKVSPKVTRPGRPILGLTCDVVNKGG